MKRLLQNTDWVSLRHLAPALTIRGADVHTVGGTAVRRLRLLVPGAAVPSIAAVLLFGGCRQEGDYEKQLKATERAIEAVCVNFELTQHEAEGFVRELTDQALLVKVAREAHEVLIREAAFAKLDPGALAKVVVEGQAYQSYWAFNTLLAKVALEARAEKTREDAVGKLTDQEVLAKVAERDQSSAVRRAAVTGLTDQTSLARVSAEDEDRGVRLAAVARLTDQPPLARIAAADEDGEVRKAAVSRLTDQAVLAAIAVEEEESDVRKTAVSRLTDQAVLAAIAVEEEECDVRKTAVSKLTDQDLLAKIAGEDREHVVRGVAVNCLTEGADKERAELVNTALHGNAADAIAAVDALSSDPGDLATVVRLWEESFPSVGEARHHVKEAGRALAALRLVLFDPSIAAAAPTAEFMVDVERVWQEYRNTRAVADSMSSPGERITFTCKVGGRERFAETASTKFPGVISFGNPAADPWVGILHRPPPRYEDQLGSRPQIRVSRIIDQLFDQPEFAGVNWESVARTGQVAVLRGGALRKLQGSEALIRHMAKTDSSPIVREAAVDQLADQPLLAEIAAEDDASDVRHAAVNRLTDQAALARVAAEDEESLIRRAAVSRLTDQASLTRVAIEDGTVGKAAVKRLTDQASLGRVAVGAKEYTVRALAIHKLTDRDLLARIAREDEDSYLRRMAARKLADGDLSGKATEAGQGDSVHKTAPGELTGGEERE